MGLTRWAGTRNGKTILDFTEARDHGWQWRQPDHMQVCTLQQNYMLVPLICLQDGCSYCHPTNRPLALLTASARTSPAQPPTISEHVSDSIGSKFYGFFPEWFNPISSQPVLTCLCLWTCLMQALIKGFFIAGILITRKRRMQRNA